MLRECFPPRNGIVDCKDGGMRRNELKRNENVNNASAMTRRNVPEKATTMARGGKQTAKKGIGESNKQTPHTLTLQNDKP
jgi:hypothetical protein